MMTKITDQNSERKLFIDNMLKDAGIIMKKEAETEPNRGAMLIQILSSRRYVQKILWKLSLDELKTITVQEAADMWAEALRGLRLRPIPEKKIIQIQQNKRPRGRPRKCIENPS